MPGDELAALRDFLALEAPFLLPHAPALLEARGLDGALLDRVLPKGDDRELWPGTSAADAAEWTRSAIVEQVAGWFRRRELRGSLTADERRDLHRVMVLSRTIDDALKRLHTEKPMAWEGRPSAQKGFRALGQEASAGLGLRMRRGSESGDIVSPLIRGLPLLLMWMDDPRHVLLVQSGKAGTPVEGRDFHVGDLARGVLPPAAPLAIGTQTLVGMALASALRKEDRVFLSVMGEGGTSLGEWHEALTFAAARRLPVIFVVENNRWALGTHLREQTIAPRFAPKAAGYGIPGITIFGNDPDETAAAGAWAAERARAKKGPTLVELSTYRRAGHAHHDDDRFHGKNLPGYEFPEERAAWEAADPIALYEARLKAEGVLDDASIVAVRAEAARRVDEAEREVRAAPWPEPGGSVFAPRSEPGPAPVEAAGGFDLTYDEAVRDGLVWAMDRDARVLVLGEDVGGRYGGAFGLTRGFLKRFGPERCLNTPLAESAILGAAVGLALAGLRPIAEMQFADFVACGFDALVNNAAKVYWRWGRPVPMVVRLPYGGSTGDGARLLGGGPFHSQCPEAWLLRTPGLKIVAPSTPRDAKGLLIAAVRDGNPVVYLEAKGLYQFHRPDLRENVPPRDYEVPIGKAAVRRPGRDVTLLAYGSAVWTSLAAAETLAKEGVEAEVVDLRTLVPLDEETILASVAKTHRVAIVHEDSKTGGVGAELAAILAEKAIFELEAPIVRVAAPDTPAPYAPSLEAAYWPTAGSVVEAVRSLLK
jgi:pyruvate/2-oxoglutarate/acetoin dehydrogenase E1 component/TPP-dependent pyruvate/acetoin dehydrogenase alpha subunit